ncbi:hypothetical protein H6P81_005890 [Aristolochia fimbriata]|uniref:RNase H type-1 domain-containing protein n=1 Tax=Aristolochia fimbriata TaxID=158543 RepID=A0AAV7EZH4_ARIFI|nr:hypothetical protein H6P81_005890 [Aristolochia fimbriata]
MWKSMVAFIPWAIWEERNRRVFHSKSLTWEEVADQTQTRVVQWLGAKGVFASMDLCTVRSSGYALATSSSTGHNPVAAVWLPPPEGKLKVNVDGSSMGNPGPAGFGVFRDSEGNILMSYSGSLGVDDSTSAETHGVLQTLRLFRAHFSGELIVEGDSKNVIGWCRQTSAPPWRLLYLFREIFIVFIC